jgi:hypothetical protein
MRYSQELLPAMPLAAPAPPLAPEPAPPSEPASDVAMPPAPEPAPPLTPEPSPAAAGAPAPDPLPADEVEVAISASAALAAFTIAPEAQRGNAALVQVFTRITVTNEHIGSSHVLERGVVPGDDVLAILGATIRRFIVSVKNAELPAALEDNILIMQYCNNIVMGNINKL